MIDNYINHLENIVSSTLFVIFKVSLIVLVVLLILSLVMLAIGCLIKSQKIKSKFLKAVPSIFITILLLLSIPVIYIYFRNFV